MTTKRKPKVVSAEVVETPRKDKHKETKRKPSKGRASATSTTVPDTIQRTFDELAVYFKENIPESTACALIGLDVRVWEEWCGRYPGLRLTAKKLQAAKLLEWQRAVEEGKQGWQAAMTLLERLDGANFSRSAVGRPSNARAPYDSAMGKRRKP